MSAPLKIQVRDIFSSSPLDEQKEKSPPAFSKAKHITPVPPCQGYFSLMKIFLL